jgi:CBS domain containing-hemolysin-like protein
MADKATRRSMLQGLMMSSARGTNCMEDHAARSVRSFRRACRAMTLVLALSITPRASASLLHGETLDTLANILAWVVLIIAPIIGIAVFWLVHILPEKIAEKRKHPQAKAIQTLCLLSLVFGGLLWPLAWLWAYSKPVFYKMAYGTDVEDHDHSASHRDDTKEKTPRDVEELRRDVARLEDQLKSSRKSPSDSGRGRHISWS